MLRADPILVRSSRNLPLPFFRMAFPDPTPLKLHSRYPHSPPPSDFLRGPTAVRRCPPLSLLHPFKRPAHRLRRPSFSTHVTPCPTTDSVATCPKDQVLPNDDHNDRTPPLTYLFCNYQFFSGCSFFEERSLVLWTFSLPPLSSFPTFVGLPPQTPYRWFAHLTKSAPLWRFCLTRALPFPFPFWPLLNFEAEQSVAKTHQGVCRAKLSPVFFSSRFFSLICQSLPLFLFFADYPLLGPSPRSRLYVRVDRFMPRFRKRFPFTPGPAASKCLLMPGQAMTSVVMRGGPFSSATKDYQPLPAFFPLSPPLT